MLKLPKSWELNEKQTQDLEDRFRLNSVKLWAEGSLFALAVTPTPDLLQALGLARRCGKLKGGLENIETLLQREEAGLAKLRTKLSNGERHEEGQVSRLLLVTNDGSERFYRKCESLLKKHGHRLVCFRLEIGAAQFGERFFGQESLVKAALVDEKSFVGKVFSVLAAQKVS